MYLKNFPKKLKKLRTSYNLTQSDLASILHTTKQAISSYESGKVTPSLIALIRISEYFNISLDSLVFDNDTSSYIKLTNNDSDLLIELLNIKSKIDSLIDSLSKSTNISSSFKNTICKSMESNEEYSDELVPNIIDLNSSKKEQIYREIKDFGPIPAGKISLTYEDNIEFVSIPEDNLNSSKGYYVLHISGDSMNKLYKDGEIILVENTSCVAPGDIVIARIESDATIKRLEIDDEYISLIPESTNPKHKIQTFRHKDICIQGKVIGRLSDYL